MNPLINDVTTTPEAPPQFEAAAGLPANRRRDMSYPAAFAEIQRKSDPDLRPLSFGEDPDRVYAWACAAARKMPRWQILREDPSGRRLEAVATTPFLRFKDDVVIEVRREGQGSSVHLRSKSRLGRGDLGANARRIRVYLDVLKREAGQP